MVRITLWLGKYRILSVLNSSSMQSLVFLAENVRLGERCIIKKIRKNHPFFQTVSKEAFFLGSLKSRFLPKLYDVEEDEEALYFILEYLHGFCPDEEGLKKNPLTDEGLFELIRSLSDFLSFLHERDEPVLYLDWKPSNLIVTEEGLKIIDFGAAMFYEDRKGAPALATEGYSAPELNEEDGIGLAADIYGFGRLALFFTERMKGGRKGIFRKGRREKLLLLAEQCLKKEPEKRYNSSQIKNYIVALSESGEGFFLRKSTVNISIGKFERTIGLSGSFRGVGVSHVSTLIASFLARQGAKVALVFLTEREMDLSLRVERGRLEVFCGVGKTEMTSILNYGYQHIVIDFGVVNDAFHDEFLRCDKKFMVCQFSTIRRKTELAKMKRLQSYFQKAKIDLLLNLAEPGKCSKIKEELRKKGIKLETVEQGFEKIGDG